ncbi:hypothetical protein BD779DRAFT_1580665 [Infundibulicybe gibba]|nr:hypothetical protein BD779DRAFT_1580665 [Infundibulicybe gibba]
MREFRHRPVVGILDALPCRVSLSGIGAEYTHVPCTLYPTTCRHWCPPGIQVDVPLYTNVGAFRVQARARSCCVGCAVLSHVGMPSSCVQTHGPIVYRCAVSRHTSVPSCHHRILWWVFRPIACGRTILSRVGVPPCCMCCCISSCAGARVGPGR